MNILVVAAHPDDEVLGCGATIAQAIRGGAKVDIVFMADGESSRKTGGPEAVEARKTMARKASSCLGANPPIFLGFPDNQMDSVDFLNIVQKLEAVIEKAAPDVIYTHHHGDLNIDHTLTYKAVMTACRPTPESTIKAIYGFEILSSTDWTGIPEALFQPNCFRVLSTEDMQAKLRALKCYSAEIRAFPHARSERTTITLAELRGSQSGRTCVEAFRIIRLLQEMD